MSTQETRSADLAGRSAVLPVHEVVALVREWVDLHARHLSDFVGAYLWGGITALPAEARFPLYRDVDVVLNALSGLLAVAQLKRPTTRRTLALLGELLDEQGRADLHEAALKVWGSAHMSRANVQAMLDQSVAVFDRSVEVYHTPTPYGFTIRAHLRPYLAEATQEMIDEGKHCDQCSASNAYTLESE